MSKGVDDAARRHDLEIQADMALERAIESLRSAAETYRKIGMDYRVEQIDRAIDTLEPKDV